jgi:hypothetical protein
MIQIKSIAMLMIAIATIGATVTAIGTEIPQAQAQGGCIPHVLGHPGSDPQNGQGNCNIQYNENQHP